MDMGKKKENGMATCGSFLYSLCWLKETWRREGDPIEFWVLSFWPYVKKMVQFILMLSQDYRYTVTLKIETHVEAFGIYFQTLNLAFIGYTCTYSYANVYLAQSHLWII